MTDINTLIKFESYELNTARRELTNSGVLVEIEPRVFDVLLYLINNHDRVVNKDELLDAIWPGMIVTETALTRAVMKARKAIGDNANRQDLIKTIQGHGYRFIAELSIIKPVAAPSSDALESAQQEKIQTNSTSKTDRVKGSPLTMLAIALILISGITFLLLRPQESFSDDLRIAVLPLQDKTENQDLAWTSFGLMSYASKLLNDDNSMLVVPVGSIIGLAENFGWSGKLTQPENEKLLNKLKKVYGATHILVMELEKEGVALRMNYGLLMPDGDLKRGTIVGDGATELTQGVVQAVYGTVFHKSRIAGDVPLVSKDSFNNEAFARGMDLSLQGRCEEAIQFFQVIVKQEPSLFAPRYELAACLRILGKQQQAEVLLKTLIKEQRLRGESRQLVESMMTLGILYNRTGRLDQSETTYREALEISKALQEHVLSAKLLQNLSIIFKGRTELDEASRLLDLALLSYQDAGYEILPGQFYSGRANLSMARGELVEAEVELKQALQAFREIGDQRNEAMMLNNTGYLKRLQGKIDEGEAYHLRSLEIRKEIGDLVGVGRIYGMLSGVYSAQGHYEDAILAAKSALKIAIETKDRLFEATSLTGLAKAEKSLQRIDSARQHYLEGKLIFVEIQDTQRSLQIDLRIAQMDLQENLIAQAETLTQQVLETSRRHKIITTEVEALEFLGDIELKRKNLPAAISELMRALKKLQGTSWASKENTIKIKLANLYMDLGDFEKVAPIIGVLAANPPNVSSYKTQARFAFHRGDSKRAVELMSRAKQLAGKHWSAESEATLKEYQNSLSLVGF